MRVGFGFHSMSQCCQYNGKVFLEKLGLVYCHTTITALSEPVEKESMCMGMEI